MVLELKCPECGETDDLIGYEVRGLYDGVLYWACKKCGLAWSRDWSGYGRRQLIADNIVAAHNEGRQRASRPPEPE